MEPEQQIGQELQQNEQILNVAFEERRTVNLQKIKGFYSKRLSNYKERNQILLIIQTNLHEKIKFTLMFIKDIIDYFEAYLDIYGNYFKGMSKLNLQKKEKDSFVYQSFLTSVLQLASFNTAQVDKAKKLISWIQKMLIPSFKTLQNMMIDVVNEMKKQIKSHFKQNEQSREKQLKMYQKLTSGNDLLEKEVIWFEKIKRSDEITKIWGNCLYKNWKFLLEKEIQMNKVLQQNIIDFADKFTEVYYKPDLIKGLVKFWTNMPQNPSLVQIFTSLFGEAELTFIKFGCKDKKFINNMESFFNLDFEKVRSGNPLPYINILQNKRFKAKIQKQKSLREWIDVFVIFSVDKNVLFYYEVQPKIILKLKSNDLSVNRTSQNILELKGIEEGTIFDSNRKQLIHFDTFDLLEQFQCYIKLMNKPSS